MTTELCRFDCTQQHATVSSRARCDRWRELCVSAVCVRRRLRRACFDRHVCTPRGGLPPVQKIILSKHISAHERNGRAQEASEGYRVRNRAGRPPAPRPPNPRDARSINVKQYSRLGTTRGELAYAWS